MKEIMDVAEKVRGEGFQDIDPVFQAILKSCRNRNSMVLTQKQI